MLGLKARLIIYVSVFSIDLLVQADLFTRLTDISPWGSPTISGCISAILTRTGTETETETNLFYMVSTCFIILLFQSKYLNARYPYTIYLHYNALLYIFHFVHITSIYHIIFFFFFLISNKISKTITFFYFFELCQLIIFFKFLLKNFIPSELKIREYIFRQWNPYFVCFYFLNNSKKKNSIWMNLEI